jgi:hypothetical protein
MTKDLVIPWELKYKYAIGGWLAFLKSYHYAIREEYGAAAVLKMYEKSCKMNDRTKNFTKTLIEIFNIVGNDAETIAKWIDIWFELVGGFEHSWFERSKILARHKITKCPYKTEPIDISDWCKIWFDIVTRTINPKATFERPEGMCAGDSYCTFVFEVEEE